MRPSSWSVDRPARIRAVRRLAALSAACTALFGASSANAEEKGWNYGGGIFIGYAWGAQPGLVYGAEAFTNYYLKWEENRCVQVPESRIGVGPIVRFAAVLAGSFQVTLAGHGGGEIAPGWMSATGELGGTYRFGAQQGAALHTGANLGAFVTNFAWNGEWGLDQMSVLGGVRFWPLYGSPRGSCVEGRPYRDAHGAFAEVPSARREVGAIAARSERAKRAGAVWERDARNECASIPAFLQLAAELLAHDAPVSLVERALDAAHDEMAHARLCAEIASRYCGETVHAVAPTASFRPAIVGDTVYLRFAAESWLDGCLGEGAAAARAVEAAKRAHDPVARAVRLRIARDEGRHAELGWSILSWALSRRGNVVRDALAELSSAEIIPSTGDSDLERYGCLDSETARRAGESVAARCRYRLETTLQKAS